MHLTAYKQPVWLITAPSIKRFASSYLFLGFACALLQQLDYYYLHSGLVNQIFFEQIMFVSGAILLAFTLLLSLPVYWVKTQWLASFSAPLRNWAKRCSVDCFVRAALLLCGVAVIAGISGNSRAALLFVLFALYFLSLAELTANLPRLHQPSRLLMPMLGMVIAMPFACL